MVTKTKVATYREFKSSTLAAAGSARKVLPKAPRIWLETAHGLRPMTAVSMAAFQRRMAGLGDLIGSVEGLPADLSARKRHYLRATGYGRTRREPKV